jgi:hypothetical protein
MREDVTAVRITRTPTRQKGEDGGVSLSEWEAYLAADPDLEPRDHIMWQSLETAIVAPAPIAAGATWIVPDGNAASVFWWEHGEVVCCSPRPRTIEKARAIAEVLGAECVTMIERKLSDAEVTRCRVAFGEAGLKDIQFTIVTDDLADATVAIRESFDWVVSNVLVDIEFSGDIMFGVSGSSKPHGRPSSLLTQVRDELEETIAARALKTRSGRPLKAEIRCEGWPLRRRETSR